MARPGWVRGFPRAPQGTFGGASAGRRALRSPRRNSATSTLYTKSVEDRAVGTVCSQTSAEPSKYRCLEYTVRDSTEAIHRYSENRTGDPYISGTSHTCATPRDAVSERPPVSTAPPPGPLRDTYSKAPDFAP